VNLIKKSRTKVRNTNDENPVSYRFNRHKLDVEKGA
jgi:hypothetical protein